ncbi:G-type lectin S-receptor-like serine/threonine-protein kinase LECRK3 [Tanacetum coccineum]|uniref:Receptor-like serine/threonine-protein kinase n=1 Tax=Tanacetum coccineum TaxID=301880 RepID=A0ABQ5DFF0_9ASTR
MNHLTQTRIISWKLRLLNKGKKVVTGQPDQLTVFLLAQRNGSVPVGSSLTATDNIIPWLSPSGDFAFGFQRIQGEDNFVLSIWYDKIPDKTIVWYPQTNPVLSRGSKVELINRRGLVLSDPQGREVWNSSSISDISYGVMNDTGNFVIVGINSSKIWESFNYPADTMLPTQVMERGGVINSKMSKTNFSRGRYQLKLLQDGNLVLNSRDIASDFAYAPYYSAETDYPSNQSNSGDQVIFDATGYMYVLKRNGQRFDLTTRKAEPPSGDYYHRATLDSDGVLTRYSHAKDSTSNTSWEEIWLVPARNICVRSIGIEGSKACGLNNVCSLDTNRPNCECPQGTLQKNYCAEDCFCAVAIYGGNECWKKKLPLSNGRRGSSEHAKAFLKFRKGDRQPQRPSSDFQERNKDKKSFFLIYKYKARNPYPTRIAVDTNLPRFTYQELVEATGGFKDELGKGAFGIVYKGVIGINTVAVKKLYRVFQESEKEFQTEVNGVARTHHKNLVQLLGYCKEGDQRLLVYEYMSNGTIASFLFKDIRPCWEQRRNIALGIAKGLSYLHEECSTQVIHCDIKPQNILLDDYYNAKISDFGLAKLLMINQSQTSTGIRGTKGYVAPEWFRNTPITAKVDVYSFGVLLLEIISCRKSLQFESGNEDKAVLTDWVWDCYQEGRLDTFVENDLEALDDYKRLKTLVMVAIWCVQETPSLRPTMRKVIQMLEGIVEVSEPPCPFLSLIFCLALGLNIDISKSNLFGIGVSSDVVDPMARETGCASG